MTTEQREMLYEAYPDGVVPVNGEQTDEQAINFAIESFRHACQFDSMLPIPEAPEVRPLLRVADD